MTTSTLPQLYETYQVYSETTSVQDSSPSDDSALYRISMPWSRDNQTIIADFPRIDTAPYDEEGAPQSIKAVFEALDAVTEEDLDPATADDWYFKEIKTAKNSQYYNTFLKLSLSETPLIRRAILRFIGDNDSRKISPEEEQFIRRAIAQDDLDVQKTALNTLLAHKDFIRNKSRYGRVVIKNKYLDKTLKDFINA